ncbi:MAG: hypothetical protein JNM27_18755 [Leptospirales bacterium]|nr:hypothetical protein [Leptospirales bacterium]
MTYLIQGVGVLQIGLAILHLLFPARFNWREETARLSLLNRQIFYVHTFFVCVILVLFGLLSVFFASELLRGDLFSRAISGGISAFWFMRLLAQLFVYDSALWKGKTFETTVHIAFILLWIGLTSVYAMPVFRI